MIKAVIFDMDGLVADTEHLQSKAFTVVLKEYGHAAVPDEFGIVHTVGIGAFDNWKRLAEKHGLAEDVDKLVLRRRAVYLSLLKENLKPMPGLLKLLKRLKANGFTLALASSSAKDSVDLVLSRVNIRHFFDAVVSGDQVKHIKPFPDLDLEAARRLNVLPVECVVLEDSKTGVVAAKRAGMKVIAVPNALTKGQDFAEADLVVDSLEKIDEKLVAAI